jgi:phosphopantothenoylcysteine decarboxylase / phosphopantothenate---cysteine ligase
MNNHMYEHPATRANLETLRERGVGIVEPGVGRLASKGELGVGRLAEPDQLLSACEAALVGRGQNPRDGGLSGLRVLVTAGGTREPIDSVRFVGNSSSGRMGFALARAAGARGAEVTLVAANVGLEPPPGVVVRKVVTASELMEVCEEEFPGCDVLLMAAAVADFAPSAPRDGKIKKSGHGRLELELEATPDVLAGLAEQRRDGQTLIGFAAEDGDRAIEYGREKLIRKGLDAVVVNDISRGDIGFDSDANEVTILTVGDGRPGARGPDRQAGEPIDERHVPRAAKEQIAETILDAVELLRAGR